MEAILCNCIICGPVLWGPWSLLVIFWSLSPSHFLCIDSSHSGSGHFRCVVFSRRTLRSSWEFFVTDFALSGLENFDESFVLGGSHFFFEANAALLSITASFHSVIFSDLYSGKRRIGEVDYVVRTPDRRKSRRVVH